MLIFSFRERYSWIHLCNAPSSKFISGASFDRVSELRELFPFLRNRRGIFRWRSQAEQRGTSHVRNSGNCGSLWKANSTPIVEFASCLPKFLFFTDVDEIVLGFRVSAEIDNISFKSACPQEIAKIQTFGEVGRYLCFGLTAALPTAPQARSFFEGKSEAVVLWRSGSLLLGSAIGAPGVSFSLDYEQS